MCDFVKMKITELRTVIKYFQGLTSPKIEAKLDSKLLESAPSFSVKTMVVELMVIMVNSVSGRPGQYQDMIEKD